MVVNNFSLCKVFFSVLWRLRKPFQQIYHTLKPSPFRLFKNKNTHKINIRKVRGGGVLSLKKGIAVTALIIFGIYAVQSVGSNPRAKDLISRLTREKSLTWSDKETETSPTDDEDSTKAASTNSETMLESLPPFPSEVEVPETEAPAPAESPAVLPTTIEGGMVISNDTSYELDLGSLVSAGTSVKLAADGPQILIIHTHGSEAYTPDKTDSYEVSDTSRTQDTEHSIIRVGDELASCFESYGLSVIHDRSIYDYPSYTGSYTKSQAAVESYLKKYPSISVVLDVHRDAIGDNDVVYKTVAESGGKPCAQFMLLVGTGENGLEHPNWRENLKFALYLQSAVVAKYPSLPRPISLKKERYNQNLSTGYLILEVGSSGNTLSEALNAVRLFADASAPALKELRQGAN